MNGKTFKIVNGDISDGYHTFEELYEHRCALFVALLIKSPDISWYSLKHSDGSDWPGWFIAGMELPSGDITYHLPVALKPLLDSSAVKELPQGKAWDGHTSNDVVTRLKQWTALQPTTN